jgi:hypothetical protein
MKNKKKRTADEVTSTRKKAKFEKVRLSGQVRVACLPTM